MPVWFVADDLVMSGRGVVARAFAHEPVRVTADSAFHHSRFPPVNYDQPDWAAPVYLGIRSNVGTLECWTVPNDFPRGARAVADPLYRGEVFVSGGKGEATLASWTPNSARVSVRGGQAGAMLVYNMNWDPSWRANGVSAVALDHAVATSLRGGDEVIEFRYRPRTLPFGLALAVLGLVAMGGPTALRGTGTRVLRSLAIRRRQTG